MKFENIQKILGDWGKFQRYQYLLLTLPTFFISMQTMSMVFSLYQPEYRCAANGLKNDTYQITNSYQEAIVNRSVPYNYKTESFDQCYHFETGLLNASHSVPCTKWVFSKNMYSYTAVEQFELVCGRNYLRSLSKSFYLLGYLLGSITFGIISDNLGRKKTFLLAIAVMVIGGIISAWTPEIISYLVFRVITGAGIHGNYMTGFVLALELVGPSMRSFAGLFISITYAIGSIILDGLAYFIRDWRVLTTVVSVLPAVFLIYQWLVPESVRWLLSQGRQDEAWTILEKAAKYNGVQLPEKCILEVAVTSTENPEKASKKNIFHLFQHRVTAIRTLIIFFNW